MDTSIAVSSRNYTAQRWSSVLLRGMLEETMADQDRSNRGDGVLGPAFPHPSFSASNVRFSGGFESGLPNAS